MDSIVLGERPAEDLHGVSLDEPAELREPGLRFKVNSDNIEPSPVIPDSTAATTTKEIEQKGHKNSLRLLWSQNLEKLIAPS